jgi:excisionase family DNA binding protein
MPFLTAKDVAIELNIPLPRVYELTRRGQIPAVKLGDKQLRFDPEVLREWLKRESEAHGDEEK